METLKVYSKISDYDVFFSDAERLSQFLAKRGDVTSCFVIDSRVYELYSDSVLDAIDPSKAIVIDANEDNKSYKTVFAIYDEFISRSINRRSSVITIGGGIVQDVASFVCSTFHRGVDWIFIPTTLLAQADSCIGGKTSLNFSGYKNLLGTFFPPKSILICTDFLKTLDDLYYYSGMGEVAKLHIMGGKTMIQELAKVAKLLQNRDQKTLDDVIKNSLEVKISYMLNDEFDRGKRHLLNYGHCFGHALESSSDFVIPHGQAVTLGIVMANSISVKRGLLSPEKHNMIQQELLRPILTVNLDTKFLDQDRIADAMKKDKKRIGDQLTIILLSENLELREFNNLQLTEISFAIANLENWISIQSR